MKIKPSNARSAGFSGYGLVSLRRKEPTRLHSTSSRLQRISGALLEEAWLPMSLRSLIAEELLLSGAVDQVLAQKAQAVLSAAEGYGLVVSQSNALVETELLSQELSG